MFEKLKKKNRGSSQWKTEAEDFSCKWGFIQLQNSFTQIQEERQESEIIFEKEGSTKIKISI